MEGNSCSSICFDAVNVKNEPEYGFNEQVRVKEEDDNIKEEREWEDSSGLHGISAAAARAGLYANHEVKDELVLGPVGVQPPDIAFTLYACQASAARAQPELRECVARPETHVANNTVGNQVHSNAKIHTHKQTYICDICNKRFALKTRLMEHVMIHIHQEPEQEETRVADNARGGRGEGREPTREDGRHACLICRKDFPTPSKLERHERVHTGKRPFSCGICQQKFTESGHLKSHERTHTGERQFSCGICQKKFTESGSLKRHERTHTGERRFSCGICKQKFMLLHHLKRHERIHTGEKPYSCGICQQKFTQLGNLKTHERIHTGEKPFSCGTCQQKFMRSGSLKTHKRTHTGERPFACDLCKKQFTELGNLKKHKDRFHADQKPFLLRHLSEEVCEENCFSRTCTAAHGGATPLKD